MPKVIDLTGQCYGNWTVLSKTRPKYWSCRCVCGTTKEVFIGNLRPVLKSNSCGCVGWSKETRARNATTHGQYGSPTYLRWKSMKRRVKSREEYAHVSICPEWLDYNTFLKDMGECPAGYSLERIDNKGNYEPANCKWIPKGDQSKNTRRQIWFDWCGQRLILSDWCRSRNLPYSRVLARIRRGWPIEQALELAPRKPLHG